MSDAKPPDDAAPGSPLFQVRIPLEWSEDADVPIVYANQVKVVHNGPDFFIVFGVVVPPTNPSELPDALTIQPQARVVIASGSMPGIVSALADSVRKAQARQTPTRQPPRSE